MDLHRTLNAIVSFRLNVPQVIGFWIFPTAVCMHLSPLLIRFARLPFLALHDSPYCSPSFSNNFPFIFFQSYKDNGAKLRRMKDVARTDEVVEIKDGIEFCDHMVETLSDEIVSLRSMSFIDYIPLQSFVILNISPVLQRVFSVFTAFFGN